MIKLEIEPYCDDCLYFDADVQRPERAILYSSGVEMEYTAQQSDTIVRCQHRKLCKNIKRYLQKQDD